MGTIFWRPPGERWAEGRVWAAAKNQTGVEMALIATGQGIEFSPSHGGVEIKLKK